MIEDRSIGTIDLENYQGAGICQIWHSKLESIILADTESNNYSLCCAAIEPIRFLNFMDHYVSNTDDDDGDGGSSGGGGGCAGWPSKKG